MGRGANESGHSVSPLNSRHFALTFLGSMFYWPLLRRNVFFFILPDLELDEPLPRLWLASFYLFLILLAVGVYALGKRGVLPKGDDTVPLAVLFGSQALFFFVGRYATLDIPAALAFDMASSGLFAACLLALSLMWAARYVQIGGRIAATIAIGSFGLSFFVKYPFFPLGDVGDAFASLMPLASFACLMPSRPIASSDRPVNRPHPRLRTIPQYGFIALSIVFLIGGGVIRGLTAGPIASTIERGVLSQDLISVVFTAIVLAARIRIPDSGRTGRLFWSSACIAFLSGLLLVSINGAERFGLGNQVLIVGRTFLGLFLWLQLVDAVRESDLDPVFAFGICFVAVDATSAIAGYAVIPSLLEPMGLSEIEGIVGTISTVLMFVLAAVSAVIYMRMLDTSASRQNRAGPDAATAANTGHNLNLSPASAADVDERLENLARRYALTPKETHTAKLLVSGYGQRHAAEVQGVSLATVQAHVKSLYRKLGIHSKQELVDLAHAGRTSQNDRR